MKPVLVLSCLIAAALAVPAQTAAQGTVRMYKCIGANGKVYYSDRTTPDCGQSTELNRHGVPMQKKQVAKPVESSKAGPEAGSQKTNDQERRNRALLATYTSEEEIDAARDRTLAIPAQATKSVELKLDSVTRQLTELKGQADTLAAQNKPLPAHLLEEIDGRLRGVSELEADLARRKAQSDAIRARYEADKQRFRELKGAASQ